MRIAYNSSSVVVLTVHRWVTDPMLLIGVSIWTIISTSDLPVHELTFSLVFSGFHSLAYSRYFYSFEKKYTGSSSFNFDLRRLSQL